jgi:hypothetical protein
MRELIALGGAQSACQIGFDQYAQWTMKICGVLPCLFDKFSAVCLLADPLSTRSCILLRSSGAIHGNVPRAPPETKVWCFTFDKPISPILQTGRCGSLILTRRFSHFKSKWTTPFSCKYSMPNVASIAKINLLRRSTVLSFLRKICLRDPFTVNSVTAARVSLGPS